MPPSLPSTDLSPGTSPTELVSRLTTGDPSLVLSSFDLKHFLISNILILIVSHFASLWLAENVPPRGYWFYFTLISTLLSIVFW